MKPEEKAKELYLKLQDYCDGMSRYDYDFETLKHNTKQCALIAVNETMKTLNEDIKDIDVAGSVLLDLIEYWQEVKNEIDKL